MGKGDKKSRRGKIILGTFGVRRRRKAADKVEIKPSSSRAENKPLSEDIETSKPSREVRKPKAPAKPKKEATEVKETRPVKDTGKSEPKTPKAKKA